jgi:glucan phosphoethanolaminetransferase (alkaline phosphatase superfamily)
MMKNVFSISILLALQPVFAEPKRTIIDSFTSSGVPVISVITLFLAVIFFFVKGHLGVTFRANKKSVLIALLMITLFAWPFKYFKQKTVDSNRNSIRRP